MLYLYVNKNEIKLLYLKKSLLGQYESAYYEKTHTINLQDGKNVNIDLFASAVKEAITLISSSASRDREIQLVLPQDAFHFLRADVPADIAPSAVSSFINDKARAQLMIDLDTCAYDYLVEEKDTGKQVLFFAMNLQLIQMYQEALKLLNLQLSGIIPEILAYYKLFEKTLRKDKKEYIMYVVYEKEHIHGYAYDTFGPLEKDKIEGHITASKPIEDQLKKYALAMEEEGKKVNRLILSGNDSESIRQDTFTKHVGVWTNPLKRIIPQFYQEYLKILVTQPNQAIPFLQFDVCIGAFIFSLENKYFSFFKKKLKMPPSSVTTSPSRPPRRFPLKEISIFVGSSLLTFGVLMGVMRSNAKLPDLSKFTTKAPTPTAIPKETATPTPSVAREDVKVKILNGSGIAGKASIIKDSLQKAGYGEILTGNADNFDYQTTEIQIKKSKSGISPVIKNDLKDFSSKPKITTLAENETADVIIIIGADVQ